jgi:hypothetical protein
MHGNDPVVEMRKEITMGSSRLFGLTTVLLLCVIGALACPDVVFAEENAMIGGSDTAWWVWPLDNLRFFPVSP